MKTHFPRTVRWMQDDQSPLPWPVLALLLVVSLGWGAWFFLGRVKVYAVAQSARTEVDRLAHGVQAPVEGVVAENRLVLGSHVEQGDVLLVIDSTAERLRMAQEKAKQQGQRRMLEVLERQWQVEQEAQRTDARAIGVATQAARAKERVARTMQEYASAENKMMQELRTSSLATGLELLKSMSEAKRQQAEATAASIEASRIAATGETGLKDRAVEMVKLEHDIATLQADIALSEATVAQHEFDIGRRTVRAAVSGVVADLYPTPPGSTILVAQKLAVIVPVGESRMVARMAPADAVGRVKPGQRAVVKLDAFPWTEYGVVKAQVAQVAREPQDGMVRTELVLASDTNLPLGHGLTGSVEVELEETAPYRLLLRAAGQLSTSPPPSNTSSGSPSAQFP